MAGKAFAWERPFSKAGLRRFGDARPPDGPILAVSVEDLDEKEAVPAAEPDAFFTIPHFEGYAAVLVQLRKVRKRALRDAILDGWLAVAPPELAEELLAKPSLGPSETPLRIEARRPTGPGDQPVLSSFVHLTGAIVGRHDEDPRLPLPTARTPGHGSAPRARGRGRGVVPVARQVGRRLRAHRRRG